LGRIHLLKGRLPQAAQQLLALIEEHPNHGKRADALLDLADVLIGLGSKPDACNALAEFRRSADNASDRLKARAERTAAEAGCAT
jgi:TolA-binding protein